MPSPYKIQRVNLNNLTPETLDKLKRYTAGSIGTMVHYLRNYVKNPSPHAYAYVAVGPNSEGKKDILGWGMAHRPRPNVEKGVEKFTDKKGNVIKKKDHTASDSDEFKPWELNLYVPKENRGRGLAQKLARHAVHNTPARKLKVYIFSDDNQRLYKGLGVRDNVSKYNPHAKGKGKGHDDYGHLTKGGLKWADDRRARLLAKGTVVNPETGNKIKIITALRYDRKHPARIAAKKMLNNT